MDLVKKNVLICFNISHDGSGWCWYICDPIKGVFVDGIHGTPYIAAPWIRHGYVKTKEFEFSH
jgi:hypothetical protein